MSRQARRVGLADRHSVDWQGPLENLRSRMLRRSSKPTSRGRQGHRRHTVGAIIVGDDDHILIIREGAPIVERQAACSELKASAKDPEQDCLAYDRMSGVYSSWASTETCFGDGPKQDASGLRLTTAGGRTRRRIDIEIKAVFGFSRRWAARIIEDFLCPIGNSFAAYGSPVHQWIVDKKMTSKQLPENCCRQAGATLTARTGAVHGFGGCGGPKRSGGDSAN